MQNLVSVIIPAYNKESTIEKAVDCVLDQSHYNIEVVVVDDCSTDNTYFNCKKYFNDIVLCSNPENLGLYATRLTGLEYANGDYITFLDADDWLDRDAIKRCLITALDTKADIVQMKFNHRLTKWEIPIPIRSKYNKDKAVESCLYNECLFPVSCCGKFYTRDILLDTTFMEYDNFWGEDRIFNLSVYENKPKIAINKRAEYNYRWGGESVNQFKEGAINDYVAAYETKRNWAIQNGYEQYLPQMEQELKNLLLYYIRHMIDSNNYTKDEIITFLGYELTNTPWREWNNMPTPDKLYNQCYNSISRIIKRKLRSYF